MREKNLQSLLAFFGPWALLFIVGFLLRNLHDSILYFHLGIGITSFFTLLQLWYCSTGKEAQSSSSVVMSLLAISLKMFACTIIFIYYFFHHKEHIQIPLSIGSLIFLVFTTFEVYIGLKYSKNIS